MSLTNQNETIQMERKNPQVVANEGKMHLSDLYHHFFVPALSDLQHLHKAVKDEKNIRDLRRVFAEAKMAPKMTENVRKKIEEFNQLNNDKAPFPNKETCVEFCRARSETSLFTMMGELKEEVDLLPPIPNLRQKVSKDVKLILNLCIGITHDGHGNLQPWIFEYYDSVGAGELLRQLINKVGLPSVREQLISAVVIRMTREIVACSKGTGSENFGITLSRLIRHQWQVNLNFISPLREAQGYLRHDPDGANFFEPAEVQAHFLFTNPCLDAGKFIPLVRIVIVALKNPSSTPGEIYKALEKDALEWTKTLLKQEESLDNEFKQIMKENVQGAIDSRGTAQQLIYVMWVNYFYYLANKFPQNTEDDRLVKAHYKSLKEYINEHFDKFYRSIRSFPLQRACKLVDLFDKGLREFQRELLRFPESKSNFVLQHFDLDDEFDKLIKGINKDFEQFRSNYLGERRTANIAKVRLASSNNYLKCYLSTPLLQLMNAINQLPQEDRRHYFSSLKIIWKCFRVAQQKDKFDIEIDLIHIPIQLLLKRVKDRITKSEAEPVKLPSNYEEESDEEAAIRKRKSKEVYAEGLLALRVAWIVALNFHLQLEESERENFVKLKPILRALIQLLDAKQINDQLIDSLLKFITSIYPQYAEILGNKKDKKPQERLADVIAARISMQLEANLSSVCSQLLNESELGLPNRFLQEHEKLTFDRALLFQAGTYFNKLKLDSSEKDDLTTKTALLENLNLLHQKVNSKVSEEKKTPEASSSPTSHLNNLSNKLLSSFFKGACKEMKALFIEKNPQRDQDVLQVLKSINTGTELDKAADALERLKSRNVCQLFIAGAMGLIGISLILLGIGLLIQTGMASQVISHYLITFGTKMTMLAAGAVLTLGAYPIWKLSEPSFVKSGNALFKQFQSKDNNVPLEAKRSTSLSKQVGVTQE